MSGGDRKFGSADFTAPVQQRSREALERVYSATNALLDKQTFDKVKVSDIAKSANVAVGSIYQRFGSKDDLLWIMYGSYAVDVEAYFANLLKKHSGSNQDERVFALLSMVCELFRQHGGIVKSLLAKYRQDPESIPGNLTQRIEVMFEKMTNFIASDAATEDEWLRAQFALSTLLSSCREQILFRNTQWTESDGLTVDRFKAMLAPALCLILNSETPNTVKEAENV